MEPTGVMDSRRLQDRTDHHMAGHFTVCDLADEEVHFSRNSSDYYYCRTDSASSTALASSAHAPRKSSSSTNGGLSSIDLANHDCDANTEQVISNRLLNNLSNKLRRGSNYLNAPAKLVGQYLLGITIQSWAEFFNTSRMTKAPCARHQLTRRLVTNLNHFQGNYLCVSLILVIYCILTSPLLLIAIAAYLMALYLVTARSALGKQTRIFGYRLNLQQQYSFITMLSLPPLWIAGAPSAVFWVIGASFFVVGLHASIYANELELAVDHQLVAASRMNHSLAQAYTPAFQVNRQPCHGGYTQIGGLEQPRAAAPKHYYNHYPASSKPEASPTGYQGGPSASAPSSGPPSLSGATSYVPSALSQWNIFGGSRATISSGGSRAGDRNSAQRGGERVPEVKVISRDYAGLGRVYEV